MAIDWINLATQLLNASDPITAVATATGNLAAIVDEHILDKSETEKAKIWRDYSNKMDEVIQHLKEVKDGQDATEIISDFDKLLDSK
jgi:phosphopantothenate synthetase